MAGQSLPEKEWLPGCPDPQPWNPPFLHIPVGKRHQLFAPGCLPGRSCQSLQTCLLQHFTKMPQCTFVPLLIGISLCTEMRPPPTPPCVQVSCARLNWLGLHPKICHRERHRERLRRNWEEAAGCSGHGGSGYRGRKGGSGACRSPLGAGEKGK